MNIQKQHLDFISEIYDYPMRSNSNDGVWRTLLDRFAASTGAKLATLTTIDMETTQFKSLAGNVMSLEDADHYDQNFQKYDTDVYQLMTGMPAREFYGEADFHDDSITVETSIATRSPQVEFLKSNYGIYYRAAARLNVGGRWMDTLAVSFSEEHGAITQEDKQLGAFLLPHMAVAVELNRTFMLLQSQFSAVLSALDALNIGVFITESSGQVVVKNNEASRILDLNDGLVLTPDGRISAHQDTDQEHLANLIKRSEQTARGENQETELKGKVSRRSSAAPYLLSVSPLRDDRNEFDYSYRGAVIFVIDPDNSAAISTSGFSQLYGLTAAEAEIAELLAKGASTEDIAETCNVKPATIKSHIRSLLKKTGGHQRSDLIRLALSINIPVMER